MAVGHADGDLGALPNAWYTRDPKNVRRLIPTQPALPLDTGYAEITNKAGKFVDRDLYLVVYGLDGTVRAHGANEKMVGKNLIDLKDVDGKAFVKERVELAQAKGTFWQGYKFTNPTSKKIEPKSMYCERVEDMVVCGGIYK